MSSAIAKLLSLGPEDEQAVETQAGKLKSLVEFFGEAADALKDNPVVGLLGHLGKVAGEWSGTAKAVAKLFDIITRETSAANLGWLACSLAYREAAEKEIQAAPRPSSRLPFSAELVRSRLSKLRLEDPSIMSGFSLEVATAHPFVRAADQALWQVLSGAGYDEAECRKIIRSTRSAFTSTLREVLTGENREKFAAFTQWLQLGSDDIRLFSALTAHVDNLRKDLEEKPALGIEPFTLDQVYTDVDCGELRWSQIQREPGNERHPVDPFAEASAPREDLMTVVLRLIKCQVGNDPIVILGAPGSGKSTFTKKLAVRLHSEGLLPIRIPLQHLRVDLELFDAIVDVLRRFDIGSFESRALRDRVYSEKLPVDQTEISPYVFVFDGWDEINLAADEGFQQRVNRLFDRVRDSLIDQTRNRIRVVLTGRPSQAIAKAGFLRETTAVLTIRPLNPGQLSRYVDRLCAALAHPLENAGVESWKHPERRRFEPALAKYAREFAQGGPTLDVLGQPLLAHLAMRLLGNFDGDQESLIEPPTNLYRHLTDITCKNAARNPSQGDGAGRGPQIAGGDLRSLLHGTALAITAFGAEVIPKEELLERLSTLQIGRFDLIDTQDHPLTVLMIAFFFKEVTEYSGCEFLHKSLREYLAAEGIVEVLKEYGRRAEGGWAEKASSAYWKDFEIEDPRHWLSRKLGEIFCGQWLSDEIIKHLSALLEWEIDRAFHLQSAAVARRLAETVTSPLASEGWELVRDGLSDLWDWWGEGVHLRPQPTKTLREWKIDQPPFVFELQQRAMRRDNHQKATPPRPLRTATVDAHVGYGLFCLASYAHGLIADASGWAELVQQKGPDFAWRIKDDQRPRRYQVLVQQDTHPRFVLFAPSGQSPTYFRNYVARIIGAGVAPPSFEDIDFPGRTYLHAVCLRRCDLSGVDFDGADLSGSTLARATLVQASFRGAVLQHASLRRSTLILADLESAELGGADMRGAYTYATDLFGASLAKTNITQQQVDRAVNGNRDSLPPGVVAPNHWRDSGPF